MERKRIIEEAGVHVTEPAAQVPLEALQIIYEKQISKKGT
jgi:hypothetical protein